MNTAPKSPVVLRRPPRPADESSASPAPTSRELARVARFLERLARDGFFGKITITFQNGQPQAVHTEQSMKIDEIG